MTDKTDDSDPQLNIALREILAVMKKHDLGGFISVHNKEGGQFQPFFPTWTTATFRDKTGGGLALHFKVDEDPASVDNQDTLTMFVGLRDTLLKAAAIYERVSMGLAKHSGVELVKVFGRNKSILPGPRIVDI